MAKVTRKLLILERHGEVDVRTYEIPSAEELGWIARNAYCNERDYPTGKSSPKHILSIGQAILDALIKRREDKPVGYVHGPGDIHGSNS